ncbi:MAG: hypothetical protein WCH35_07300 [Comamonadaceae bacterium]
MKIGVQQRNTYAVRHIRVALACLNRAASTREIGKANNWALAWNRGHETLVAGDIDSTQNLVTGRTYRESKIRNRLKLPALGTEVVLHSVTAQRLGHDGRHPRTSLQHRQPTLNHSRCTAELAAMDGHHSPRK